MKKQNKEIYEMLHFICEWAGVPRMFTPGELENLQPLRDKDFVPIWKIVQKICEHLEIEVVWERPKESIVVRKIKEKKRSPNKKRN